MHVNDTVTFATCYKDFANEFKIGHIVKVVSRGSDIAREVINAAIEIPMSKAGISMFSHPTHRVLPVRFMLAEMCAMLAGKNDIATMESYHKGIRKYSNDGVTLGASYGEKLHGQLDAAVQRLRQDAGSRQAVCAILQKSEAIDVTLTHLPCNVFLQFIIRDGQLHMIVTSRSSDFVTGFSIDTIHWQFLLVFIANALHVEYGSLYYNIGSLHVYEKDVHMMRAWDETKMFGVPYQHFIMTHRILDDVINACQKNFTTNMPTEDLADLLGIDAHGKAVCRYNDDMFKLYRNKLER